MLIKFKPFVRINFKVKDDYIAEIIERVKEDDEEAKETYSRWVDAYDEALKEGDY